MEPEPELITTPNACYVLGVMPSWVWLQVTGVKKGDDWQDWMGEPIDLKLKLYRIDNEFYSSDQSKFPLAWWLSNPTNTQIFAQLESFAVLLNNSFLPGCTHICPDIRQSPDDAYFYGGLGEVWTTFDAFGFGYKDKEMNELLAPDDKTYFEPAKPDNDIRIARYARHRDGTRVYIRRSD